MTVWWSNKEYAIISILKHLKQILFHRFDNSSLLFFCMGRFVGSTNIPASMLEHRMPDEMVMRGTCFLKMLTVKI